MVAIARAPAYRRGERPQATVFITIDGESLTGLGAPRLDRDPYRDDGGEG
jgi:hypothetical protein